MLTLDKALDFIQADEPEVVAVFQSESPVTVAVAGQKPERCEAYVCVLRKDERLRVFAALATAGNRNLIYVPQQQPETDAELAAVVKEAKLFVEAMGFVMESLNLNYGAAMRAVVIRNIRVLQPPRVEKGKKPPAGAALRRHEKLTIAPRVETPQKTVVPAAAPVEKVAPPEKGRVTGQDDQVAALRAEIVSLTAQRSAAAKEAAAALDALRAELAEVTAERNLLADQKEELVNAAEQASTDLAHAWEESHRLAEEREVTEHRLTGELAALQGEMERLRAAQAEAEQELAQAKGAAEARSAQLATVRGDAERLGAEREAALARVHEFEALSMTAEAEVAAARAEREELAAAREQSDRKVGKELAALRAQLEQAKAAMAAAVQRAAEQEEQARLAAAELTAAKEEAEQRLGAEVGTLRGEQDQARAERAAAEQRLAEAAAADKAAAKELAALRARVAELEEGERPAPRGKAELARQAAELTSAKEEADRLGVELGTLRGELDQARAERAAAEQRLAEAAAADKTAAKELAALRARVAELEEGERPAHREKAGSDEAAAQSYEATIVSMRDQLEQARAARSDAEAREHELAVLQQKTKAELAAVKGALERSVTEKVAAELAAHAAQAALKQRGAGYLPPQPAAPRAAPPAEAAAPAAGPAAASALEAAGEVQESGSVDDGFFLAAVRTPQVPWDMEGIKPTEEGDDPFAPATAGVIGFPPEEGDFSDFGGAGSAPGLFVVDSQMAAVEYGEPDDVVELQTSINVARITPEGDQPQNSTAYICGVRSGESTRVYVALHLLQSGRVIIYVPEEQPAGEAALRQTLRGAIGFAEAVGFMMDTVTLSDDPAARREALRRVPALRARAAGKDA
jgi:hypothetical protein